MKEFSTPAGFLGKVILEIARRWRAGARQLGEVLV